MKLEAGVETGLLNDVGILDAVEGRWNEHAPSLEGGVRGKLEDAEVAGDTGEPASTAQGGLFLPSKLMLRRVDSGSKGSSGFGVG